MSVTITTSWDDGHTLDLRVAHLLDTWGVRGTFYIARDFLDERLSAAHLRDLATRHEIGAHTLTHPILTRIAPQQAREEIIGSKQWLEDVLGTAVTAFCYPRGAHNATVRQIVREAGFALGRTTQAYQIAPAADAFALPTTVQLYPFPARPLPAVALPRGLAARWQPLAQALHAQPALLLRPTALRGWPALATHWLQRANAHEGIWHLWGHSWEIDRYDLWDDLQTLLQRLSQHPRARFVTNSALIAA